MNQLNSEQNNNKNLLIVTLGLGKNYGGILQAYALQHAVKRLGFEPYSTASPESVKTRVAARIPIVKKIIFKILGKKFKHNENSKIVAKYTNAFIATHINTLTFSEAKAKTNSNSFRALIAGSDQVWRKPYTNVAHNLFSFDKTSTTKISYAASFGVNDLEEYTPALLVKTKKLASKLTAISVRERAGVNICRENWEQSAIHHVDPTLLVSAGEYSRIINEQATLKPAGDLFSYVLDTATSKQNLSAKVSGILNLNVFTIISGDENAGEPMPPVEQWLRSFRDAKYIITDSFHGTVFAIIFNKPFIAVGNKERGLARFTSLLKMFGLEDRLVTSTDDITEDILNKKIDWNAVNTKIKAEQKRSFDYLKKYLG